jgi:outer membrane protein assembly factor BamB
MTGYIGYRGFRSLGFVGGSADKVFALDIDLGRLEWQKAEPGGRAASASAGCPGGMTANVARPVSPAFPTAQQAGGRGGFGRGGAAKSDAGAPGEGATILKQIEQMQAEAAARRAAFMAETAPGGRGARGGRGPGERPRRMPNYVYALGGDGMLHGMYVSNGEEPEPPIKFVPPNANAHGLIIVDNIAYVVTTGGCGGAADGVWALDLESKQVATWPGKVAGAAGVSFGGDGTVYVATTGGDLVALDPKTLKAKETYSAKQEFATSPVTFPVKDQTWIAAATKDGRIHVVDAAGMKAAGEAAASAAGGALATWQDAEGTRWLLAPTTSAVAAWKLSANGALQKGWTSRDISSPVTPMIVNGVVFAASRGQRSQPAVLYALDGSTGKELWNSGKSIASFVPEGGGLSGGGTQIYLGTHDGTLYAFGFPMEH